MKKMRSFALIVALIMALTVFTGCGSGSKEEVTVASTDPEVTEAITTTEEVTTTTEETTTEAVTTTTEATTVATTVTTTAATTAEAVASTSSTEIWIASWGTAMQTAYDSDTIPSEATSGRTVTIRQQIRPSLGGDELRLTISNQYGSTPLIIDSMELAMLSSSSSYKIDTSTCVTVTYNGSSKITVPAGQTITTDTISFSFDALDDIAVTMKVSAMPSKITLHRASRCTNWIISGSHVSDNSWSSASEFTMWYFLAGLDVMADSTGGAIVCLGDSLTDGASIDTNSFARYTDKMAELLQSDSKLSGYSVINMGVGGTPFLGTYDNSTGLGRVTRDIVEISGVKYCIVFMGVNDIGYATTDISQKIIDGYEKLIDECHEVGIKVIGCTITPFNGSSYYSELHEQIRQTVNKYITSSSSEFDGYIDLASAVASDSDSSKMASKYVSTWNDYLHFNATGYRYVGTTIYNYLKNFIS